MTAPCWQADPYDLEASIAETSGSVSLAAAIFASVLTASRMRTALHVCVQAGHPAGLQLLPAACALSIWSQREFLLA